MAPIAGAARIFVHWNQQSGCETTWNSAGGYYVAGTRIALDSLIHLFRNGDSPETILRSFALIGSLERVYGAITCCLANKEAVEAYLEEQNALWREAAAWQRPLPAGLAGKLQRARDEVGPSQS